MHVEWAIYHQTSHSSDSSISYTIKKPFYLEFCIKRLVVIVNLVYKISAKYSNYVATTTQTFTYKNTSFTIHRNSMNIH